MTAGSEPPHRPATPRPRVSVVMTVYNAQAYLTDSILSVLDQTLSDLELILVDDGSDDASPRLMADFAARDPRVILLRQPTNTGIVPAANRGLAAATGEYVARMDADDICRPDRLAHQVAFLDAHAGIFLVGSDAVLIDRAGRELARLRRETRPERLALLLPRQNRILHPTVLFRNDGSCSYREKMRFVEDYDFYLRLLSRGEQLANLPRVLLKYRRHAQSVSLRNRVHQVLFAEQAREFYRQRLRLGRDEYDRFDPQTILGMNPEDSTEEHVLYTQVVAAFSLNALPETRRYLRRYFRHHGVLRRLAFPLYYAAAGLPPGLLPGLKRAVKRFIPPPR